MKLLKEAKINSTQAHQKPNMPVEITAAVAIWSGKEEIMSAVYADARIIYINVTAMR